ncbi:hypothetical protein ACIRO1_34995 [Streptomyces sp. NPDC102381]|uniref:hypothetical protein n=1 Tax=Streptomyces sp. NPDC102381 TaxID=3366164 RepID=UPI00382248C1
MTTRRIFLLAFLLTTALLAGAVTVLATRDSRDTTSQSPAPDSVAPSAVTPSAQSRTTRARSRAAGKAIMGNAWSSTWSATVPSRTAVPARALGSGRCAALYGWATARSAVPRGTASAAFTLSAPDDSPVVVRSLRIVKGRTVPAPQGQDVECVGAVDRTVGQNLHEWGELSLDAPREVRLSRYVRPGGTTGGIVDARTLGCSCEWWIELEVLEGGAARTVRIDDAGRPFTIASPVARIGAPADDDAQRYGAPDLALARGDGSADARATTGLSVSGTRLFSGSDQEMWMVTNRKVRDLARITADLDVPGAVCPRLERSLMAAGARPAAHATYAVLFADKSPDMDAETITDISLHVERPRRLDPEPTGYACYPDDRDLQGNTSREEATVLIDRATQGDSDPSDLPVFTEEPVTYYQESARGPATDALFFGVSATGPADVEYHFTIEVTLKSPSGKVTHYTLDDAGRPFAIAARPVGEIPGQGQHLYREVGKKVG